MGKPVILTGIRSNGELTLGNYLGAILPLIQMQQMHAGEYQVNMFVPDLHSITTQVNFGELYTNTINNLKVFCAAGLNINNEDSYIYRQSYIAPHSELAWILDCFLYFGELGRMTQFKDKSAGQDSVSVGLFNYPALMAADILLYGAKYVPVGEDQRQHLELTRDVAIRFNNSVNQELFVVPEVWEEQMKFAALTRGVRIRSLKRPEAKMSKSVEDPAGTILLSDKPAEAADKIIKATTDSVGSINLDFEAQPGISNLLQIIALLSARPLNEVATDWQGKSNYGELKAQAASLVEAKLNELQLKVSTVDNAAILAALERDEAKMRTVAAAKLTEVQSAIGLRQ